MNFLQHEIAPLGLGCWPVGGDMYAPDGTSLGYSNVNDKESIKALEAALANGIRLFDTAAAYGAGHSERLLAKVLADSSDAIVVTKIGIPIDEDKKQLSFTPISAADVLPAIDQCRGRLQRDVIDLVLLHQNELPVDDALPLFEQMNTAVEKGWIGAYGWSTDFTDSVRQVAAQSNFAAVEHAMNVLIDAPALRQVTRKHQLIPLIRSPLAMGLLSGNYTPDSKISSQDVRGTGQGWLQYFDNGKPNPVYLERLSAIRELLQSGGRSTVQGALCWLWARNNECIPIPGARTVQQVESLAQAVSFGPLPDSVMAEIESLIDREERAR